MIKHIFFDFNGTLINDVDLCLELLNEILESQNKKPLDMNTYKHVFKFPIKEYYKDAGVDFNIESFESLSIKFVESYQPKSMSCGLFDGVIDTLKALKEKNIKTYILSASEKNNLLEQCKHYGLVEYFDDILGIDNIEANSKVDIAIDFINSCNINKSEALFIGDTLHDYEVSLSMGVKCRLVSCGHQAIDVLNKAGVIVYDSINDVLKEV